MNTAFSRSQFPPSGWVYFQAVTGWHAPTPKSSTFDQTVLLIRKMRQANPALCLKHGLSTDIATIGNELEAFTKRRCGIVDPAPTSIPSAMFAGVPGAMVSNVSEIKKMALGSALILGWERSGKPAVPQEDAEARAVICASCPMNSIAKLTEWSKSPVGISIQSKAARVQRETRMVKSSGALGLCEALYAPAQLLDSMPMDVIHPRLKQSEIDALHAGCWILENSQTSNKT